MARLGSGGIALGAIALGVTLLSSQDTYCPSYPMSQRVVAERARKQEDAFFTRHVTASSDPTAFDISFPPEKNIIDQWTFRKMSTDGVEPAPLTTETEFLRRIYLDLTGRIPTPEQALSFLNSSDPKKRSALVEQLLASPDYVDQISHWFLERFQVKRGAGAWISTAARNNFYRYIRDFVQRDRPYDAVARELLTASGDSDTEPALGFLVRQVINYYDSPAQDFWDDFTNTATVQFLGFKSECISCHDGRGHLEKINLFLTPHTRREFWRLSAFFSRTRFRQIGDDSAFYRPRLILTDVDSGLYTGAIDPSHPGDRPSRSGANEQPNYWFTAQYPATGNWRSEFARLLTSDPQFARAAVNYLWAYFFGSGIVDPPDGWDLARVDPSITLPDGWPMQNTHPELLDALADAYRQSNYSTKTLVRLIVNSSTYQLSSRYTDGKWKNDFLPYFARYQARRLTAEKMFDSLVTATGTQPSLAVDGLANLLTYANQLPHPYASTDWDTEGLLDDLGRGDWINRKSLATPSLFGTLDFMNRWSVAIRTRAWSDQYSPLSRLALLVSQGLADDDIVKGIFLATLTRYPTTDEMFTIKNQKTKFSNRLMWLTGVQWALLQKSDFVFEY